MITVPEKKKKAKSAYPDKALNAFMKFANDNLPLPKMSLQDLKLEMGYHLNASEKEVSDHLEQLSSEEILNYGKWLDRKILTGFNCNFYEGGYDPIVDLHRIVDCKPEKALGLLDDANDEIKNIKHKTSHRAASTLKWGLKMFEIRIYRLHEDLEKAAG